MRRYRLMISILSGISIIAAATIGNSKVVFAEDAMTAINVMPGCRDVGLARRDTPRTDYLQGVCVGTAYTLATMPPLGDCVPPQTNEQLVRVIVKYIDSRPELLHENFQLLAYTALREMWPCQR
jgi:hypothetical protein